MSSFAVDTFVVDTNVAVVANGRNTHASEACQLRCITKLQEVVNASQIVIDDKGHILNEYHNRLNFNGQPGVGDFFYKHIFNNQGVLKKVRLVTITPMNSSYKEFPSAAALNKFDNDDRKFVAAALQSNPASVILNAVDTDWAKFHNQLASHGVKIDYLCPCHVTPDNAN